MGKPTARGRKSSLKRKRVLARDRLKAKIALAQKRAQIKAKSTPPVPNRSLPVPYVPPAKTALVIKTASKALTPSGYVNLTKEKELYEQHPMFLYEEEILRGRVPACEPILLACEKNRNEIQESLALGSNLEFRWNRKRSNHAIDWISRLPLTKGTRFRGKPFDLLLFQKWVLANMFGWEHKELNDSDVPFRPRRFQEVLLGLPRKNGKALALDTLILTTEGWKTMGDIKAGDYVFGSDGKPTKVLHAHDVLYDRECHKLSFDCGEEIVACEDHKWVTHRRRYNPAIGREERHPIASDTKSIHQDTISGKCHLKHRIALTEPLQQKKSSLPLDPYFLGAWLGDGSSAEPKISNHDPDRFIIDKIISKGYQHGKVWRKNAGFKTGDYFFKGVKGTFRDLGLLGNKHIPEVYQTACEEDRRELLRGMMDTDGWIQKGGSVFQVALAFSNKTLIEDAARLVRGLGYKVKSIGCKKTVAKDSYTIQFSPQDLTEVFSLQRKMDMAKGHKPPSSDGRSNWHYIQKSERVKSVPVRCLTVQARNHQFLVGKTLIPTHNSELSAAVGLYGLCADGELKPEVAFAASNYTQAKIPYAVADDMVRISRSVSGFLDVYQLDIKGTADHFGRIYERRSNGDMRAFATDKGGSRDGLFISVAVCDECHAWKDGGALYKSLRYSMVSREQPLTLFISTTGVNLQGFYHLLTEEFLGNVRGEKEHQDPTRFCAYYTLDKEEEYEDPSCWIKAHPALGHLVKPKALQGFVDKAKRYPRERDEILTKQFNIWVLGLSNWVDADKLRAVVRPSTWEEFHGHTCIIGLDLAFKNDLVGMCYLFFDEHGNKSHMKFRAFVPQLQVDEHYRNGDLYKTFASKGDLTIIDGAQIDLEVIAAQLELDFQNYDVTVVGMDSFMCEIFARYVENNSGAQWESRHLFKAKTRGIAPTIPVRALEGDILDQKITYDGNIVATWCFHNVQIKSMGDGALKTINRDAKDYNKKDLFSSAVIAYQTDQEWVAPEVEPMPGIRTLPEGQTLRPQR